jgi:thiol-disulfide isomerase/thioredoxin
MPKISSHYFFCILTLIIVLATSNTVSASGPNLLGSMKKFKLEPTSQSQPNDIISWKTATGKSQSLTDYRGRVVLINYWATWCLPCIQELPSIDRLQAKLGGTDFAVIAISLDRGGKTSAMRTIKRLKLKNLSVYTDIESKSAKALGVLYMPTTFVFDREGRKLGALKGKAEWDDENAIALIKYFIQSTR